MNGVSLYGCGLGHGLPYMYFRSMCTYVVYATSMDEVGFYATLKVWFKSGL